MEIQAELSFFQRAMESGPLGMAALALLVIAGGLCLIWLFLAIRRRRLFPLLAGTAIILAAIGYLVFDWRHISLNLAMRDAQNVRDDCVQLIQRRKLTNLDLYLSGAELPPSFTRIGAKAAQVHWDSVQICLFIDNSWGGKWGFRYDPQSRPRVPDGWPGDDARATWYRDFYEFRERGE